MRAVAVFLLAAAIGQAQPSAPSVSSPQDTAAHDSLFASALRAGSLSAYTVCLACGTINRTTDGNCAKCGRPLLTNSAITSSVQPSDRGARLALHGLGRFHVMSGIIGIVGGGLGIAVAAMLASEKKWNTESSLGFAVPCGFTVMAIWEVGLGSKLLDTPVR